MTSISLLPPRVDLILYAGNTGTIIFDWDVLPAGPWSATITAPGVDDLDLDLDVTGTQVTVSLPDPSAYEGKVAKLELALSGQVLIAGHVIVLESAGTPSSVTVTVTTLDAATVEVTVVGVPGPPGADGGVATVNGQIGDVVLDADDIGADPAGTAADLVADEAADRAGADGALDGRLDVVEAALPAEAAARSDADSALDGRLDTVEAALPNKADLVGGVIPAAQIPAIAISDYLGDAASEVAMLAFVGQRGDWATRSDAPGTWIVAAEPSSVLANWVHLPTPADAVTSVNGRTGTVSGLAESSDLVAETARATAAEATKETPAGAQSKADAKVAQTITNGVTTSAPSQDVVFDALALKQNAGTSVPLAGHTANSAQVADASGDHVDLAMAASTILARLAAGNIVAATPAQLKTLLAIAESDVTNLVADLAAKTPLGGGIGVLGKSGYYYSQPLVVATTGTMFTNTDILAVPLAVAKAMTVDRIGIEVTTIGEGRTVADGVLNSTTTVTSGSAAFVAGDVGKLVVGTGIPAGATIASRTNATTIVLSQAATATASGVSLTFSCVIRLGIYEDNGTGYPGALLLDAGIVTGDTNAIKEITISQALTVGLHWLVAVAQGAPTTLPTVRCSTAAISGLIAGSLSSAAVRGETRDYRAVGGAAGALPPTFPASAANDNRGPIVIVRCV